MLADARCVGRGRPRARGRNDHAACLENGPEGNRLFEVVGLRLHWVRMQGVPVPRGAAPDGLPLRH
eukprot:10021199-Heterocapsa_arctica.AAC.1